MARLSAQWREQQAKSSRLGAAIDVNLPSPDSGD